MFDLSQYIVGKEYTRPFIAETLGYKSYNAISRGAVTPSGLNLIILFVTEEKQEHLTQYEDRIDQDILFWEGEEKHGSDNRIITRKDTVVVFYRKRHHSSFRYEGRARLTGYKLYSDRPSKFIFQLEDRKVTDLDLVREVQGSYQLSETEKEAIIKSRRGQGLYRRNSIKLWQTCAVTGFTKKNILIASHIKPWKVSVNFERLDPCNSLLLVPTLDKLFDNGYIGFQNNGRIIISDRLNRHDLERIGVTRELGLRQVPNEVRVYLEYHYEYRFDILIN